MRETGVAWMGLSRKLHERSEVRVLEYPPYAAVAQLGRALDCHSRGRGFDPRYPLHVAVVQLVEHQIVALVVVDSSSTGHPIDICSNF